MLVTIKPSKAFGTVSAPPSKSLAHRMLICAGLSNGESVVRNLSKSEDVLATLDCLSALGATYTYENDTVTIRGADLTKTSPATLPCRECGSTLRFFVPIALLCAKDIRFTGSERLMARPLGVYEKLCAENGFKYEKNLDSLTVSGRLSSGVYEIPGDISSQFITGLLFALPLLESDSVIKLIPPVESRSYINLTLQALHIFGIKADWDNEYTLSIKGSQQYVPCNTTVEGDYSNAAFLDALTSVGSAVNVEGLDISSLQGDRVYKKHFVSLAEGTPTIDISDCPDLGPILFALASYFNGATFIGTHRLKIKESDRAAAMACELSKFGAVLNVEDDTVTVKKKSLHAPSDLLDSHNDHRIVMSLATLCTAYGGTISGAEAVKKSYPDYFEVIKNLGIDLYEE